MSKLDQVLHTISELSEELDQLSLEHRATGEKIKSISQKLQALSEQKSTSTRPAKSKERRVTLEECRQLIGAQVRIINPRKLEECFGTISKVGTLYVIVQLPNGNLKRRIANNIRVIEE